MLRKGAAVAEVSYDIEAVLRVKNGEFNRRMDEAAARASKFGEGFGAIGTGIENVMNRVGGIASGAATAMGGVALAGVAGIAYAAKSSISNLQMLEDKGIQMASVMAAATSTPFETMKKESDSMFARFRTAAITSAGETADFVNTASLLAGPILGAGKSMTDLENTVKGVIATAPALGASFQQAGSDVMRMLQGSAGAELPFFKAMQSIPSLGIKSAEAFNKMSQAARFDAITKALSNPAFKAGAEAMGQSLTGLLSTAQDVAKNIGGGIFEPFYTKGKAALSKLLDFMNGELLQGGIISNLIGSLGARFDVAFERLQKNLARIFPPMETGAIGIANAIDRGVGWAIDKAVRASGWLADHWSQIVSLGERFAAGIAHAAETGKSLVTALGGGDFTKGLERVAELYAAKKIGGDLLPFGSAAASFGGGIMNLGKMIPGLGGGAAAGGAGAAGAAASGAGAAGSAAAASGPPGWAMGLYALRQFAIVAAVITAAVYAANVAIESGGAVVAWAGDKFDAMKASASNLITAVEGLGGAGMRAVSAARPLIDIIGTGLVAAAGAAMAVLGGVIDVMTGMAQTASALVDIMGQAANAVGKFIDSVATKLGLTAKSKLTDEAYDPAASRVDQGASFVPYISTSGSGGPTTMKKGVTAPASKGGGGKQEITVKFDFGDGNEEAIYIRTRKDMVRGLRNARIFGNGLAVVGPLT